MSAYAMEGGHKELYDKNNEPLLLEEFEKALSEELYEIYSAIYISGEWPRDFLELTIIPVEKKNGAQECVDFRTTISQIQYASKTPEDISSQAGK